MVVTYLYYCRPMKHLLTKTNQYLKSYLLKNAKVVNTDLTVTSDVLIENGKVTAVEQNLTHKSA